MAHLTGFGVENFRIFKKYTWFEFAPITILVGPNSSGKSSLIKALLLLKDNIKNAKGPLSTELEFYGTAHKLGSPSTILSNKSSKNTFSYVLPIYTDFDAPYSHYSTIHTLFNKPIQFNKQIYRRFIFTVENNKAISHFQENLVLADLTPIYSRKDYGKVYLDLPLLISLVSHPIDNGNKKLTDESNHLVRAIHVVDKFLREIALFTGTEFAESLSEKFIEINLWDEYQVDEFQDLSLSEDDSEEVYDEYVSLRLGQVEFEGKKYQLPGEIKYIFSESRCIRDYLKTIFPEHSQTTETAEAVCFMLRYRVGKKSNFYTDYDNSGFNIDCIDWSKIHYLPSIKSEQRRSFRVDDNNPFNLLINNVKFNTSTTKTYSDFLARWSDKFGLGEIQIKTIEELNINYVEVGGHSLADVGYGYTQLTALLMTIVSDGNYKDNPIDDKIKHSLEDFPLHSKPVVLLEEPEANLHPKFQSQLADLINESQEFVGQFIIETHSEYLIRKFQYLVAKKKIKPEDIVVYYFNDPSNVSMEEEQVKKINILEDGSLSDDFGTGFYDEAAMWELELLKLKLNKNQNN